MEYIVSVYDNMMLARAVEAESSEQAAKEYIKAVRRNENTFYVVSVADIRAITTKVRDLSEHQSE